MECLSKSTCEVCRIGADPISPEESVQLLTIIPEWEIAENKLVRTFKFRNFAEALDFTNQVGKLAEEQGHHPLIETAWGMVKVFWWTHKIDGLHRNDFIMAAKTDILLEKKNRELTDES
jgi:4a-hydroxytetrahydrobiopterin dehydratase